MSGNSKRFFIAIILVFIFIGIVVAAHFTDCLFYENIDDPQYKLISSASFNHKLTGYPLFHIFSLDVLSYLNRHVISTEWYDGYLYGALGLTFLNFLLVFLLNYPIRNSLVKPLFYLTLISVFIPLVLFINMTRISILLSASAVILVNGKTWNRKIPATFYFFLCQIIAFDLRIEGALLGGVFAFFLVTVLNVFTTKKQVGVFGAIVALIAVLFSVQTHRRDSFPAFKNTADAEPYVFALLDRQYLRADFIAYDLKDSVKYEEVFNFFIPDKNVINADFLQRITNGNRFIAGYHNDWMQFWGKIRSQLVSDSGVIEIKHAAYLIWISFLTLFGIMYLNAADKRRLAGSFILFSLIALTVLWYVKMEDRVFIPLLEIYILAVIVFLSKKKPHRNLNIAAVVCATFFTGLLLFNLYEKTYRFKNRSIKQKESFREIGATEAKYISGDIFCSETLLTLPFSNSVIAKGRQISCFDSPYLIFSGGEKSQAPIGYGDFIKSTLIGKSVIVLSSEERLKLLQKHLMVFYNMHIAFTNHQQNYSAPSLYSEKQLSVGVYTIYSTDNTRN